MLLMIDNGHCYPTASISILDVENIFVKQKVGIHEMPSASL
jgi:hypothetical protein